MRSVENAVQETLELIHSVGLPHPSGPLLESFVTEAVSPVQAALYVSERLRAGECSSLLSDWTYIIECTKKLALDSLPRTSGSFTWQFTSRPQIQERKHFNPIGCFTNAFLATWLIFPKEFRMFCYNVLRRVGLHLYGPPNSVSTVQRLPFGLYLKYQGESDTFRNEFNALQMVHKYTSIPAPNPLDIVSQSGRTDTLSLSPDTYLLLTRLPGLPLSRCQYILSDRDCEQISNQMKDYLSQIRGIPKTVNKEMAICNTLGEACHDPRICGGQPVGPFTDEAAFSQTLRYSDDAARRGHKIVFTHADLNPRNILVDKVTLADGSCGWVVTGIVDWETSGYYPDYWDYTKSMFEGFRWTRRYNDMLHKLFMEFGDYSKEFDVEKRSWESGDGV
ncbi:hypothetical protein PISL3812_08768 [Talaromyces islandicus]|uniref:Aminoglycoside phosphotransferase domain-containing protein n=1 Tax=Talaromyces islandicus TaxID=28573 RepID=A0A0U1M9X4_TALIS|nr:hypothetical protein PISL3812_08768 [Talaromyces islandicus]